MARVTETSYQSKTNSTSHGESTSRSDSRSQSSTSKVLDEALRDRILSGLMGEMTDEEIDAYAENLLAPQRDAELEAAQQKYDTAKLTGEQEIKSLASELTRSIAEQKRSYARSAADVQTAALARGMGRSSYTLETLANTGDRLSRAVQELTETNSQKTAQAREQMALSAQQNAQTQGRINMDYARQLAAKVQELKESRRSAYNQNYLTAVSGSMGSATSGASSTQGSSSSDTTGTSSTKGSSISVSYSSSRR